MDNETENKSKDSEYKEWEDKLNSIDLNDPEELVSFIENFLRDRGVIKVMG